MSTSMKTLHRVALAVALAAAIPIGAASASPDWPAASDGTTISGRVVEVFDKRFVLATDAGTRVVVELEHHRMAPALIVGEAVQVNGRAKRDEFEATSVTRADGAVIGRADRDRR